MAVRGRPRSFDREKALIAAMCLFWQKGYTATSMADLYQVMGINSPSLYAAYGSKEDLYQEVINYYVQHMAPRIWSVLASASSAYEGVSGWLNQSAEVLTCKDYPPGCMVTLSTVASEGNERLGACVKRCRLEGQQILADRLKRAVAEGELPAATDTGALAQMYISLQQGMSLQARDGASREDLQKVARLAMNLWPENAQDRIFCRLKS